MQRFKLYLFFFFAALALIANANIAEAVTSAEVEALINEAEQLRASEFSPEHLSEAREAFLEANKSSSPSDVESALKDAYEHAQLAVQSCQRMSKYFSSLVEARDRMQLSGAEKVRAELANRAEVDFARVVESVENDNLGKAEKDAKIAAGTIYAAEIVAARENVSTPAVKKIAAARKVNARKYAPRAFETAEENRKHVDALIKESPSAQSKAYSLSKRSQDSAERAIRIAELGKKFEKNPAELEKWIDDENARMQIIAKGLGITLSDTQTPEEQLAAIKMGIDDMRKSYDERIADSDQQIAELSQKLSKYEGDMADMAELRRTLQIKREAEAKIKRLAHLFNRNEVEVLLTTEADVILRMKALNFRSGSAVIPPTAYTLLDNAIKAIEIFPDRKIRIEGHTDALGSSDYNQSLSERRANSVLTYLSERNQDSGKKMSAKGYGEEKPIANNETASGREKNRRIDIVLIAPSGK